MQHARSTRVTCPCLKGAAVPLDQPPVVARADEANAGVGPASNRRSHVCNRPLLAMPKPCMTHQFMYSFN